MPENTNNIEELKKKIFSAPAPQFSTIVPDNPDIVNYDSKEQTLQIIINNLTHTIHNVTLDQFYKYADYLHSRGKFILR